MNMATMRNFMSVSSKRHVLSADN